MKVIQFEKKPPLNEMKHNSSSQVFSRGELRGELHLQSKISGGKQSLKQIVNCAQESEFEYIAINN